MSRDLTILLPARNEAMAIGEVIDEIRASSLDCNILVADNCSVDDTPKIVGDRGVELVFVEGIGKGLAVRSALKLVDTPYVIIINSDYTYPIKDVRLVYSLLLRDSYDVVVGSRYFKDRGSMSAVNSAGNLILSILASLLYRYSVTDVCSGMWGFKKEALDRFTLTSKGFTLEADFFVNSVKSGCRIGQVPIGYRARLDGSKPKLKFWDGFKIGWFLVRRRFNGIHTGG